MLPIRLTSVPLGRFSGVRSFLERLRAVWTPHAGQMEFLCQPAKFKVLACGRRWGKSDACAVKILHALQRETPTRHLVLAPTLTQARLVFERAVELLGRLALGPFKVRSTPHPLLSFGDHRVSARSGHLPRALRGQEATRIVVDEAAYLPESLIAEVAMPMLATTDGELTLISTPRGKNHFWRFFQMGQQGEHGIWSRQAPSRESPYVSDTFLAVQRELVSERAFRVEYEAQFEDAEGQVFRTEAVEACVVQTTLEVGDGPVVIGVDWARYGDYTAVAGLAGDRDEARLVKLEKFHGTSWAEAVRRVAEIVEAFPNARVLCDATGVGDPVLEALRAALPGHAVEGFVFSASGKADLVDNLAWLIERAALRMAPDPELMRELENFEARPSDSGHVRLAARGSYHDDLVMALALAARLLCRPYRTGIQIAGPRN